MLLLKFQGFQAPFQILITHDTLGKTFFQYCLASQEYIHIYFKQKSDMAKLLPQDFSKTFLKSVIWTSPYGPIYNAKRHPLQTSSTKVLRTLNYDVLRKFQYNILITSPECHICNSNELSLPKS